MTPSDGEGWADWPDSVAIVAAVRDFLATEVMQDTSGRTNYLARVAANALGVVERELTEQRSPSTGPVDLGFPDEASLALAIRSGDFDADFPALVAELRPFTEARVRVANPKYLEGAS